MSEVIDVTFVAVRWAKQGVDEDGLKWGIYRVMHQGDEIIAKGKLNPDSCKIDVAMQLIGKWEVDPKYGNQFVFSSYSLTHPSGKWGTIAFLTQAMGIGQITATKIYDEFGETSIEDLINSPEYVAEKINMRPSVLVVASHVLGPLYSGMKIQLPLLDLFKGTKIASKTANRVLSLGWNDPVTTIKDNPFVLTSLSGIGFSQCDSLRIKLGYPNDMPERIHAACLETFKKSQDQTWLSLNHIKVSMSEMLEMRDFNIDLCIGELCRQGNIVLSPPGKKLHYALASQATYEKFLADRVGSMINDSNCYWPIDQIVDDTGDASNPPLSKHQKEVIVHNMHHGGRLIILTGSPGTGKSFCLGRIIKYFAQKNGPGICACAPTGKASQRLTQFLESNGVPIKSTTIHKMLDPIPIKGGWVFRIDGGTGGFVNTRLVAIDEGSMVNNWLAYNTLRAIDKDTYVIIVGDKNQLPPVGPGTLLRDLESLENFRSLTEIRRNSGAIVETCRKIRDDVKSFYLSGSNKDPGQSVTMDNNAQMIICSKDEEKTLHISKFVQSCLDGKVPHVRDIKEDLQFITATHATKHVGREEVNKLLQKMINPNGKGEHAVYKVGDKVICTENCHLPLYLEPDATEFVANGELGYVTESFEKRIVIRIKGVRDELLVPCGSDTGNGWELGYCITVHKSQGSEWPVVVTLMGTDYRSKMVMCREWFYTALSRARECAIVIGTPALMRDVITKKRCNERVSYIPHHMGVVK